MKGCAFIDLSVPEGQLHNRACDLITIMLTPPGQDGFLDSTFGGDR